MIISYLYAKFFKKILRGKAIINSKIDKTASIASGCTIVNSSMGKYSYCSYDCEILDCKIGNFCSLANHVFIGGAQHPMDWVSTSPVFENVKHSGPKKRFSQFTLPSAKITLIGNDVWIGHGAIIKQGVSIGDGSVIASGAIVTKNVPPYSVVGGCPARIIKYRFSEDIITLLLQSKWWDLCDEELLKISDKIQDPTEFLKQISKLK